MIFLVYGDCLKNLKELDDNSVDALITDPPAGISFMNKSWDDDKGGRNEWIKWMSDIMTECLRVMKPGSHGLVWAIPRTSHWTATALENAGFEVRDVVTHLFGTGFPKSLNISKAIDKEAGAEREITEPIIRLGDKKAYSLDKSHFKNHEENKENIKYNTLPSTDEAKKYDGWGTALKPASEHWILVRKPLSEKTVAKNVLKYGTGGINIDSCRISVSENDPNHRKSTGDYSAIQGDNHTPNDPYNSKRPATLTEGRFPANLVLSHNHDCECIGTKEVKNNGGLPQTTVRKKSTVQYAGNEVLKYTPYFSPETGKETVQNWNCTEGCAVAALDEQSLAQGIHGCGKAIHKYVMPGKHNKNTSIFSGMEDKPRIQTRFGDSGGASRFFYCAKASKTNKGENNNHPTPKNTKLMEYLIKLITPENGIVLDPFMGSGSTGIACINLQKEFIGIEKELEYFTISKMRAKNLSEEVYCF